MDKKDLKQLLAGLSIAGLVAGVGAPGTAFGGSGWGSAWSGKMGAGGTPKMEKEAPVQGGEEITEEEDQETAPGYGSESEEAESEDSGEETEDSDKEGEDK